MTLATVAVAGQIFTGTVFADTLNGAEFDDTFRGQGGADHLNGGGGNDRFFWVRGDGADVIEGGTGVDTQFLTGNGFNIDGAGVGSHAFVTDNDGVTLDLHGIEAIQVQTTRGANVGDLSHTDVREVAIRLDAPQTTSESVFVNGGRTDDVVQVQVLSAAGIRVLDSVNGVVQTTVITGQGAIDTVSFSGGDGNDNIAVVMPHDIASVATITVHGNAGADTVTGSNGAESLFGDTGDDVVRGGGGDDTLNAGSGHDIIDGGAGLDSFRIIGIAGPNVISLARGQDGHVDVFANGATADMTNVEGVVVTGAAGQADFIHFGLLQDSALRFSDVDFGVGGVRDFTDYAGTTGADQIFVGQLNASTDVSIGGPNGSGVFGAVIHHVDSTDEIEIDANLGDDLIDLINLNPGSGTVIVDGGSGSDHMIAGFGTVEFVFNAGLPSDRDVIDNFKDPNPAVQHTIRTENLFDHSLGEMIANHHIFQSGDDVVLTGFGGSTLTLTHTSLASLSNSDFHFFD